MKLKAAIFPTYSYRSQRFQAKISTQDTMLATQPKASMRLVSNSLPQVRAYKKEKIKNFECKEPQSYNKFMEKVVENSECDSLLKRQNQSAFVIADIVNSNIFRTKIGRIIREGRRDQQQAVEQVLVDTCEKQISRRKHETNVSTLFLKIDSRIQKQLDQMKKRIEQIQ